MDLTAALGGQAALAAVLTLFAVVFAINLMPAFGPPTWTIIVIFGLSTDLPLPLIVMVGAVAAALGRFTLAHAFRIWRGRFSQKTLANLDAARAALEARKRNGIIALGLFALSPLPSAQLFAAVGLAGVRILPFTLAFFAGRLVSYSIYGASAKMLADYTLADAFRETLSSPLGIALQVAMLAGLVMLARIDWSKFIPRDER